MFLYCSELGLNIYIYDLPREGGGLGVQPQALQHVGEEVGEEDVEDQRDNHQHQD